MAMNGGGGGDVEEQRVRYDRQVRLWGSAAQQRLLAANIGVVHVSGLAAEVAKNLALAGVGALRLVDVSPPQRACAEHDAATNHFVHAADVAEGRPRAAATAARMHEMNPFVKVTSGEALLAAEHTVVLAAGGTLGDAERLVSDPTLRPEALVVVAAQFGATALCCFLSGSPEERRAALHRHTRHPAALAPRPRAYQLATLLWHAASHRPTPSGFRARLLLLLRLRGELSLSQLSDADIQRALDLPSDGAETSVDCSLCGGMVAQQIIARISGGGGSGGAMPETWEWMAVASHGEIECFVGND